MGVAALDDGPMATRAAIPTTVALEVDYLMINFLLASLRNLGTENSILKNDQFPRNTKHVPVTKFFSHVGGLGLDYV